MILLVSVAIGFLIGLVSGGSFAGFGSTRFRYVPILLASVVIQVLIFTEWVGSSAIVRDAAPYLYVGALIAGLFVIFMNRHIVGMWVVFAGAVLNFIVITINGGIMPAREGSLRTAGTLEHFQMHQAELDAGAAVPASAIKIADDDTRLAFLGDILPIPSGLPGANVLSIGDVLIALGAIIAVVWVMRLRPVESSSEGTLVEA